MQMGYGEPANLGPRRIFEGTVSELSTTFGSGGAPQLEISGYDRLFPLTIGKSARQWRNMSPTAMPLPKSPRFTGSTRTSSRRRRAKPVPSTKMRKPTSRSLKSSPRVTTARSSMRAARQLHFGPRQQSLTAEVELPWGGGLTSFSPEVNSGQPNCGSRGLRDLDRGGAAPSSGVPNRCDEDGHDPDNKSGPERLAHALGSAPVLRVRAAVNTQDEATARAEAILKERAQQFLKGSAECIGLPELRPDMNVGFSGLGTGFSKTYWVSGCSPRDFRWGLHNLADGTGAFDMNIMMGMRNASEADRASDGFLKRPRFRNCRQQQGRKKPGPRRGAARPSHRRAERPSGHPCSRRWLALRSGLYALPEEQDKVAGGLRRRRIRRSR